MSKDYLGKDMDEGTALRRAESAESEVENLREAYADAEAEIAQLRAALEEKHNAALAIIDDNRKLQDIRDELVEVLRANTYPCCDNYDKHGDTNCIDRDEDVMCPACRAHALLARMRKT